MKNMTEEIRGIREAFREYIILQDITLQAAAERIGWKRAGSVHKFLAGKHIPTQRRLYRIKRLIGQKRGSIQSEAIG